jgi:hypothetical protein
MTLLIGTVAGSIARRRRFDEGHFRGLADYLFESAPGEPLGPQALVARQAPGWTLPVHFHMQHQFQVVLRGTGTLGKHELRPGSVHYTSPQSGYGPIVAGEDGLDYFTLRVLTDKGAWYLPECRSYMAPGLFKEQKWGAPPPDPAAVCTLIGLRDDGLGAWAYRPAVGESVECREARSEAGRFHLVVEGRFDLQGMELPAGSCVYAGPDEAPRFTALDAGGLLVVAQFPRQAVTHHVPEHLRVAPSPSGTAVASAPG